VAGGQDAVGQVGAARRAGQQQRSDQRRQGGQLLVADLADDLTRTVKAGLSTALTS
jgi:hypothetical protein